MTGLKGQASVTPLTAFQEAPLHQQDMCLAEARVHTRKGLHALA